MPQNTCLGMVANSSSIRLSCAFLPQVQENCLFELYARMGLTQEDNVWGVWGSQTMNHNKLFDARQTGSACEVQGVIEESPSALEIPNSQKISA